MYSHPPSDSAHTRVSVSIIFVGRILNQKVKGEKQSKTNETSARAQATPQRLGLDMGASTMNLSFAESGSDTGSEVKSSRYLV